MNYPLDSKWGYECTGQQHTRSDLMHYTDEELDMYFKPAETYTIFELQNTDDTLLQSVTAFNKAQKELLREAFKRSLGDDWEPKDLIGRCDCVHRDGYLSLYRLDGVAILEMGKPRFELNETTFEYRFLN